MSLIYPFHALTAGGEALIRRCSAHNLGISVLALGQHVGARDRATNLQSVDNPLNYLSHVH